MPACFSMLLSVPIGISRTGCATVTRPGFTGCLNCLWLPTCATSYQPSCFKRCMTSRLDIRHDTHFLHTRQVGIYRSARRQPSAHWRRRAIPSLASSPAVIGVGGNLSSYPQPGARTRTLHLSRRTPGRTRHLNQQLAVAVGTPVDLTPPAQIRTGRITACGSYLGCLASKRRLG